MKEYAEENGPVDLKKLQSGPLDFNTYSRAHQHLPIFCHDVIIQYQGGLLLVIRNNYPAKNIYWVIGGRVQRGVSIINSLRQKVREECGLELENIKELGVARTFFQTDPFGHGKGTDTFNIMYYAQGKGTLKLDKFHQKPMLLTPATYTSAFRKSLHPYIQNVVDQGMKLLSIKMKTQK